VVIPARLRVQPLLRTLERILQCVPAPTEILVHVDGAVAATMTAVAAALPQVRVLSSPNILGPGGSRDVLIRAASQPWVASFDDDSYPDHADFFAQVMKDIADKPDAAVFSSGWLPAEARTGSLRRVAVFSGCGCVYNREWYLRTHGYVPREVAYNLEEVDLGLQLHALNGRIWLDPCLNVFHDHPLTGRFPTTHMAAVMVNAVLFPLIRYPLPLWPLGLLQALRYAAGLVRSGEWAVLARALRDLPAEICRYWRYRRPVSMTALLGWWRLRRSQ
jgi:GT2 family glycosyltransferase